MRAFAVVAFLLAPACSSDHHASPDAPAAVDAPADAGALTLGTAMPRLIAGTASSVLATPTVVAITYDNDVNRTDLEAFYGELAAAPAWAAQTSEYGVGTLTVGTPRHLAGTAPATITDAAVVGILKANLTGTTPAWGQPSPNTVYSFLFPNGTILDDGTGSKCCTDYDGYHYDAMVGGVDVAYAIQCQCPGFDGPNITNLQQITVVAAHELAEAATDPRPGSDYAFDEVDADHAVWGYVTGGENADLCAFADTAYLLTPMNMTHAIQRSWSNAAAAAGHDPCVPEAPAAYYQAVPEQPDALTIQVFGNATPSHGVKIAKNASGTITLHVLGDDSAGPFTIQVGDVNQDFFGGPATLTFTQPTGSYHVGDTVSVPVTVAGVDAQLAGETFYVTTTPATGAATTFYGLVGQ